MLRITETLKGGVSMSRVKIAPSRQVVIPKKFWEVLHLKAGDFLDVEIDNDTNALIFTPKDLVDKTEAKRKKWIKELVKAGSKGIAKIQENNIKADKKIKQQLFKEKYGKI